MKVIYQDHHHFYLERHGKKLLEVNYQAGDLGFGLKGDVVYETHTKELAITPVGNRFLPLTKKFYIVENDEQIGKLDFTWNGGAVLKFFGDDGTGSEVHFKIKKTFVSGNLKLCNADGVIFLLKPLEGAFSLKHKGYEVRLQSHKYPVKRLTKLVLYTVLFYWVNSYNEAILD